MSIFAFAGAAGSGKTTCVMAQLDAELAMHPLNHQERVLALTYMHGARHRLDEQLERIAALRRRYDAVTIDSFAWTICRRWKDRLGEYGVDVPDVGEEGAFDQICAAASRLLQDNDVRLWVRTSYPYLLVDEAQDLDQVRLHLIEGLVDTCCVLLAFDEFQCLNSRNRPVAVLDWIANHCKPTVLSGSHRTSVNELLQAALEVRSGLAITVNGKSFSIKVAPAQAKVGPVLAATFIGCEMLKGGTFAILSPARLSNPYVKGILEILRTRSLGRDGKVGPFQVVYEGGANTSLQVLKEKIDSSDTWSYDQLVDILRSAEMPEAIQTMAVIRRLRDARGQVEFPAEFVAATLDRQAQLSNQHRRRMGGRRRAMTIHQAKNREFDRVAVIWPYAIPPDPDDRRRLLYNAITRARHSCIIVVQSAELKNEAPFV